MIDDGGGNQNRINAAANSAGDCERFAVEGALVVCTQMFEGMSQSQMIPASGIMVNGAYELIHTDIEFEPKFEKCRYDYEDCEPDIENGEWYDSSSGNQSNGGNGILEERSFMVCLKGYGLLYVSEDGQRPCDSKRLLMKRLIKLGIRGLLGRLLCAIFGGDPVNMATGNFIYTWTDLKIGGETPMNFERFYNALDDYDGPLGRNWKHPYDIRLTVTKDGVSILFEDGHQENYSINDKGKYEPPAGMFHQLTQNGSNYQLKKSDGSFLYFNEKGQLIGQVDKNFNVIYLAYSGEQLVTVSSLGWNITFNYQENKITSIHDHAGRLVKYTYEDNLLRAVTDPVGYTRIYDYDEKGRFLSEINPEGMLVVKNEYDEENRTVRQTFADESVMEYAFDDEEMATTFTGQDGEETIYKRDDLYRTTAVIYPDGGEEEFEFNEENQKLSTTDKIGNRTYYEYDDNGNMNKSTNPLGHQTIFDYDENNWLQSIAVNGIVKFRNHYDDKGSLVGSSDGLDRKTTYIYNKDGLPEVITQSDGSQIKIIYDQYNNITQLTDGSGSITKYQYDNLHRVIKTTDGNGNETGFAYDANDNIIEVQNAHGDNRSFVYNGADRITSITDFNGGVVRFEYNSLNKPSKIINQLGRVTQLEYDVMWNVSRTIYPNGAESNFNYDENNRLESIRKPDGHTISFQYDKNGNRTVITDELGNKTHLTYDAMNQLIEVKEPEGGYLAYTYNPDGTVASVTDTLENTVYLNYDDTGQLFQETNVMGDSRYYTYTALGKIQTITDEAGRLTQYEYELGGRLKTVIHPDGTKESFTYDNNGNIASHTNQIEQRTLYHYDCLDRVTQIINPNGGKKIFTYDSVNNITSKTDELGNVTKYEYTITGQLAKVIDPLGYETHYSYDELDQLIEINQLGDNKQEIDNEHKVINEQNEENRRITRIKRNSFGLIESVTDAMGQTVSYGYNPKGQLIEKIDKDGYLTKYGYTARGDVNLVQYADGKEVQMSYNPLRQLTEVKDWLGITNIEVDSLGRPISVSNHDDEVVSYEFGKMGECRKMVYPNGKIVTYQYDELLRLASVSDEETYTYYHYDNYSRLIEKHYPNDTSTKYQFNEFGQLKQLNHYKSQKSMDQYYYDYDLVGNKTRIAKSREGFGLDGFETLDYQYDRINRLERVSSGQDVLRAYQYDPFGNRTKKIEKNNETRYTYNSLNQLISTRDKQGEEEVYYYDNRGNLTESHRNGEITHQYYFGALNRLESVFNYEKNLGASYYYNGLGHRVGNRVGQLLESSVTKLNLDQMVFNVTKQVDDVLDITKQYHNLLQRREGDAFTDFTWDFNVLSAQNNDENLHYFHDELGSPIRLINEQGQERDKFNFDEFGNQQQRVYRNQPFSYTGYQVDNISDTLYAQARQYNSTMGRFISEDMKKGFIEEPFTLNPYTYCWNEPLSFIDLDGNEPRWPSWLPWVDDSNDTGISYIFYDPNTGGYGRGRYRAYNLRGQLVDYHNYACVYQVTLITMTNCFGGMAFFEAWAGMDPNNQGIDTVIITGHAWSGGFRLYSYPHMCPDGKRQKRNKETGRLMYHLGSATITLEDIPALGELLDSYINILLLLGCSTGEERENGNLRDSFASLDYIIAVAASSDLVRVGDGTTISTTYESEGKLAPSCIYSASDGFRVRTNYGLSEGVGTFFEEGVYGLLRAIENAIFPD